MRSTGRGWQIVLLVILPHQLSAHLHFSLVRGEFFVFLIGKQTSVHRTHFTEVSRGPWVGTLLAPRDQWFDCVKRKYRAGMTCYKAIWGESTEHRNQDDDCISICKACL